MSDAAQVSAPMKDLAGYLTLENMKVLLDATQHNKRLYLIVRFLWATGCRISELLGDNSSYPVSKENPDVKRVFEGVKVKDINFEEKAVLIDTLKRRAYPPLKRRVSLDSITIGLLETWIAENNLGMEDRLFDIGKRRVEQILLAYAKNCGLGKVGEKRMHPHVLRHSSCIAFIKKNNSMEGLRKLQQNLGHANINTTAYYLQFGMDRQKEAEDVFGQF
jgi:integrase